jgi:biotin carboxyl carrier protein
VSESGRDAAPEVVFLGDGRYVLVSGNSRQLAFAARRGHETWVFIDGRVEVVHAAAGRRAARVHDDGGLMAPMPATVVRIDAAEGTRVSAGDVVITLEAMKMELPLKAARDGVVTRLHCRPGELVQPGVPLADIE